MLTFTFPLGAIFTSQDGLSNWIMGSAMIMNDVILVNQYAVHELDKSGSDASPEGLYFFRLAASHYREAAKFQSRWDKVDYVETFIAALPEAPRAAYKRFRGSYDPWEGSIVNTWIKPMRDQLFHYPTQLDPQLGPALNELGHSSTGYRLGKFYETRAFFADDVVSQMAFGVDGADEARNRVRLGELTALLSDLMHFTEACTTKFLIGRGALDPVPPNESNNLS